jgi:hypothetical protein
VVRAGICDSPDEWPWSSHRFIASGQKSCVDETLLFAAYGGSPAARAAYLTHVEEGRVRALHRWPHAEGALNGV